METLGLKSINMLSKEQYENIEQPAHDELYVVSHSGIGFPSANYDDLTIGASGTIYTAPANGWFRFVAQSTNTQGWGNMRNTSSGVGMSCFTSISGQELRGLGLAKKGEAMEFFYGNINVSSFRFIYAEGE